VPSRHRRERQPHRLWRRYRAQALVARARSPMESRTELQRATTSSNEHQAGSSQSPSSAP
jgi:hypothetical protein